ncbi:hypothetical protein G9A89_022310 [Geosiphon pyriformis]|nr:hypothetical protein G9A89_022310 [Geosiphon pyriformis]
MTAHNLWDFIGSMGEKTCVINCNPVNYTHAHCIIMCFESELDLVNAIATTPIIKGVGLRWFCLLLALCSVCKISSHISLACKLVKAGSIPRDRKTPLLAQDQFRLAPISHPLVFNRKTWASVINALSTGFLCGTLSFLGSIDDGKPLPSGNLESDIVMEVGLNKTTSGKAATVLNLSVSPHMIKLENMLKGLSASVLSLSAQFDGLVLAGGHRFDGVWVFTSGLKSGHLDAGVVVILDSSLAKHMSRVFKAGKINSFIVKAVNESSFIILSRNFNEDDSHKCASFRKCADLGLVDFLAGSLAIKEPTWTNFKGFMKTIDFIFVSSNLVNAIVHQEVLENAGEDKWNNFKNAMMANAAMFLNEFVAASRNNDHIFTKESSRFHRLELLVSKIVRTFRGSGVDIFVSLMKHWCSLDGVSTLIVQDLVDSGASFNCVCSALSEAKKSYHALKLAESLRAKETDIKSAIDKRIESFETDKGHTIKSVLEHPFHKVVLNHLVIDDELVLEPSLVKSKIDLIMKSWTQKCQTVPGVPKDWCCQYQFLEYIFDEAFSGVMCSIDFEEFFGVVSNLLDGKTAGLLGISNELWKHCDKSILNMLLVPLNCCLSNESVSTPWKEAWVSIIPKSYKISSACSTFDVLCDDNFLVLKSTTTQSLIFAIGSVIENALEKDRTSTDNTKPKVTESENIGANHLGFAKSLFQHYFFNFYVNEKISSLLGTPINTESARETFYRELIQNINLPTNHNFASIITEINKEIEHHIQQRYPITYASKGKGKLQTPAVTPQKIQPSAWKKNRVESPSNPSYYYTPESTINISSTDDHMANTLRDLIRLQSPPPPPDFGISDLWKAAESEKEEKKSEDQEFTYQNPITENPEQNLPPVIIINQLPINPIAEPIQQPLQLPPQQPEQQQLLQQLLQPPNLDPMAYALIAKLDNFMDEENDTQIWLNDVEKAIAANGWNDTQAMQAILYFLKDTADLWYQNLINKPQDFNAFKAEFLRYFSNNNSINYLVNAFTTIKQGETKAVTTYLGCFHRNLRQIQAIDANYFTAPQILNQFIRGLHSNILQYVRLLHPDTLQDAVTCARDFESTESEANHAQTVNLVMNGSSELDSKWENLHNDAIIKKILIVAKINHVHLHQPINSGNRKCVSATIVVNKDISKLTVASSQDQYQNNYLPMTQQPIYQPPPQPQVIYQPQPQIIYQPQQIQTPPQNLPSNETQRPRMTQQSWKSAMIVHQPIPSSSQQPSGFCQQNLGTGQLQNSNSQNYLSLLVTPEDTSTNNLASTQKQPLTSNIPPATITEDESLATIFPFEFEKTTTMLLFSGTALEAKPITVMYIDTKIEGQSIKLILDNTDGGTKTPIGEINNFPFEVNDIVTPIKVLVMEATQYQALVGNDWLFKVNATLDWNTQELQLTNKRKGKQKEELTWETDDLTWTNNDESELTSSWKWEEDKENKGKGKEEETTQTITAYNNTYTIPQRSTHCRLKLICINCGKKLSSMGACCGDDEEYNTATKFYYERMWNNIPGHGGTCDMLCQYMILISDWVRKKTPIEAAWRRAVQQLDSCSHDDDKIWWMALAKIEGAMSEEIKTIKDNPPKPLELNWDAEPIINLLDPEQFHKHYQELALTREEQKQQLE